MKIKELKKIWQIIKILAKLFDDVPWGDILPIIAGAYNKYCAEKGKGDPESPGEFTKAEAAEMIAWLLDACMDFIPEDLRGVVSDVADWLEEYARSHGEQVG